MGLRAIPGEDEEVEELRDPWRLGPEEIASRIGLVFQDPELGFVARTARDEVAATDRAVRSRRRGARSGFLGRSAVPGRGPRGDAPGRGAVRDPGSADPAIDADGVLARFGLEGLAGQDPFRLSQGEQRRLSLAALVLRPPAVLLLDEPTFGLDRRGTEAVMGLLDELRLSGQAQLLATHDPRLLPHCDRVVALDRGRVVFDGPPGSFAANPPYSPADPWRDVTVPAVAARAAVVAKGAPAAANPAAPADTAAEPEAVR